MPATHVIDRATRRIHPLPAAALSDGMLLQDQKYKEGCSLIEVASLHIMPARPQDPEAPAVQHRIAVQC